MSEGQTPGEVFKEYVKSLIVEIAAETPGASLVPDDSEVEQVQRQITDLEETYGDLEATLERLDIDGVADLSGRLDDIEQALSDINSATGGY